MSKRKVSVALCPEGMRITKYTLKVFSNSTIIDEGNCMKRKRSSEVITLPDNYHNSANDSYDRILIVKTRGENSIFRFRGKFSTIEIVITQ